MVKENLISIENKKPFETVAEIKDYEVKKSPLSLVARSKVISKNGGDYLSDNKEGYGPCFVCEEDSTPNGRLTVEFKLGCPCCSNNSSTSWHHVRRGCENSRMLITNKGWLSCEKCGTGYNMSNWSFSCSNHPGDYRSMNQDSWEKSMAYALCIKGVNKATKQLNVYVTNHPKKFGFEE